LGSRYLDLAVTEVTLHEQGSATVLTGLIQNSGSETAVQPTLIASFYDAQENIIGYSQHTLPDVLEPGQSVRFNLETAAPGGTAVSVKTFLIGQRLP
jgi:hypothetical protein